MKILDMNQLAQVGVGKGRGDHKHGQREPIDSTDWPFLKI